MKRFYWAAGALFLVLLGAAFVGPRFIDWTRYKPDLETAAGTYIGLPVAIEGAVAVDLLPTPRLTAGQVTLGDPADPAARIRWARAELDLRELVKGSVVLDRLLLVEPDADAGRLVRALNAPQGDAGSGEAGNNRFLGAVTRAEAIRFAVEDGTLRGEPVAGLAVRLDAVEGTMTVNPDRSGSPRQLSFDGAFSFAGRRLSGQASLQRLGGGDGGAGHRLTAEIATADTREDSPDAVKLVFDGGLDRSGEAPVAGSIRLTAGRLTALPWLPRALLAAAAPYAPGELTVEGTLSAKPEAGDLAFTSATAATDALRGTGGVRLSLSPRPKLDMTLALGTLDLTGAETKAVSAGDLLDAEAAGESTAPANNAVLNDGVAPGSTEARFATRIAETLRGIHAALMEPVEDAASAARGLGGIATGLDLAVDTLRLADGVVRQASLRASADGRELLIERAGALLPGGSDVSLFGFVALDDAAPSFEGELSLQSDDARRFVAWMGIEDEAWMRDIPADRLRTLSVSTSAVLDRSGLTVGNLLADIDAATLSGSGAIEIADGPRLRLDLDADAFNIDAYRGAAPVDPTGPSASNDGTSDGFAVTSEGSTSPSARLFRTLARNARLIEALPATLDLDIGRLIVAGRGYEGVRLTLGRREGERRVTLAVDRAAGLSAQAGLRFPRDLERIDWRLALRIESADLGQTAAEFGADTDLTRRARSTGQAVLRATVDGNPAGAGFRLDLDAGPEAVRTAREGGAVDRLTLGGVVSPSGLKDGEDGGVALQISQGQLALAGFRADALSLAARARGDGSLAIEELSADLFGGRLKAAGGYGRDATGRHSLSLDADLEGLDLGRLIGDAGPLVRVTGTAGATGTVTAAADRPGDLVSTLTARGRLSGTASLAAQSDRQAQAAAVGAAQIETLGRRLADDFGDGGTLGGRFAFADGTLSLESVTIDGAGARADGTVTANIEADRLSARLEVREGGAASAYLELEASGSIARPDIRTGGTWISGGE